ncbi:putative pap2 superfamily protein [Phaeoacremonium minimum UCRPA7]|uniref:Putative pap2 superfamily protein n=1 Tax=Phaeoacremonium minimum (strain UCR-PA7) TaxID=1286976 RepID=R8BFD3_PHAM7|nr:putative pap2 superfamily protein [Phaeoacremonium minimum UCRPA7]EON98008.1 putative pap2 superfamily protein [Phaeoacremonium minimum UCRPA7]
MAKPKLPFHWPGALKLASFNPIPPSFRPNRRRSRTKSRPTYDDKPDITKLQTSFNPLDGVRALLRQRWHFLDIQYFILAFLMAFSMTIAPMPTVVRVVVPILTTFLLLMPATRQFFLPSMVIWVYLLYFFCSRFIPYEYRPHIWVKVLPALENVMYGANLSNILSEHTHPVLDLLAWFPYGIGHFGGPAVTSAALFLFAAPGTTPIFAKSFGWLSTLGVTIAIVFPCTPPWYEKANGLEPAHYGMPGSPAGLARIDAMFGVDMYTTSFTTAPMPFGAFPSLHAGVATIEALFLSFCFPRFRGFFIAYVGWLWWATMYLNHHYAVDLVAGSLLSCIIFYIAKARWLPRPQPDKKNRWQYEYVEIGDRPRPFDEEYGYKFADGYGLGLLERESVGDSDEWTLGSSSSFSSSGRTSTTSPTLMSPSTPEDEYRHMLVPQGSVWDGDLLRRESEFAEAVAVR